MNLNRGLIKQQAKQLISGNVFKLFFICFIVYLCMSALIFSSAGSLMASTFKMLDESGVFNSSNYNEYDFDQNYDFYDFDYFDDFGKESDGIEDFDGSDFYNFQGNIPHGFEYDEDDFDLDDSFNQNSDYAFQIMRNFAMFSLLYMLGFVVMIICMPLTVSSEGLFVSFIRGKNFSFSDGLKNVFGNAFKNNYGKKLGLVILRYLIMYLLSWLFIIPGIIYFYSSYFANQIMCDCPEISPSKALETSKKMVQGNRTELFVMNLSFIPWYILCGITFGLGYIYVVPYMEATNALYYENFRIRALQEGRVNEDDFLSDAQLRVKYASYYASQFGAQNGNPYQQNGYQPYNQPNYNAQPNGQYNQPQQNYAPNQNAYYNAPQQPQQQANDYYQPQQAPQAENDTPAPNEVNTEDYFSAPESIKTEEEPKAPETRDPWEINHED
ncbi:MAG: DUF975 family protein [Eubacterium sp.]|nr:DUF975 family protein [Eubacterium sp.]